MWAISSGAECLVCTQQTEELMFVYSTDVVRAEMKYRRDRIRHDFQRPFWFQRRRAPQPPQPCAPELRARPAM